MEATEYNRHLPELLLMTMAMRKQCQIKAISIKTKNRLLDNDKQLIPTKN